MSENSAFNGHHVTAISPPQFSQTVRFLAFNRLGNDNNTKFSDGVYFDGCEKNVALSKGSCALNWQIEENSPFFIASYLRHCANLAVKNLDNGKLNLIGSDVASNLSELGSNYRAAAPADNGENILLATSPFNPQTLFYAEITQFPKTYIISSSIEAILSVVEPKLSKVALSFWLAGRPDPNLSLYSNVHQVPQGGFTVLSTTNAVKQGVYWDIDAQTSSCNAPLSSNANQKKLYNLLQHSVDALLPKNKDENAVFCQLSGGMDSTSVLAITHQVRQQRDVKINSISHLYKNTESADEQSNIKAMLNAYPATNSHFLELDNFVDHSFSSLYPSHPQSPGIVLSPKYHAEANLMKATNATTMFTGNGGDEMFWGHSLAYFDRLTGGDWKVINEVISSAKKLNLPIVKALRSVFLGPLKQYVKSTLSGSHFEDRLAAFVLPSWLTDKAKELIANAEQRPNPFAGDKHNLARYARYEGLFQTSTFNPMRSYQAVFDNYGLDVKHPLFNSHIAQFSFEVPQHQHISGEFPKLLLRQTMNNYLPEQVCWNQKKTVFDRHFANLLVNNKKEVRKLLEHEGLADLGLVDNSKVLKAFDTVMASKAPSLQVDLLYAILVQSWYQTHIA
ncbi:asparagine synthase-related protein [Alteromonas sp. BMJM2]|uniref:asparagine synthase-related protein n=1 Tax=Alteromonas sp. BMJM2 TaxID=2954241 RepID=UPI0022B3516B|nr:asparagine synthase C-terminal domain-containing protein [Alteromonas sp. BMJM2]